jgi:hypothetical protein
VDRDHGRRWAAAREPVRAQAQSRLLGDPSLCYQATPLFAGPTPVTVCGTQTNPKMVRFHDLLVGPWQITQTSPPTGWAPNPTPQTWDGTTTYLTFTNRPV